jgi:CBS domain containing-hemolysin-like protein
VSALIFVLYPIVWISEKLTKIISRRKAIHIFSREEFIAMAKLGEQTGHIPNKESSIIRNLFRLNSLNVTDIMTPRTVAFALPENATVRDAMKQISQNPFSRILIYRTDIDHITGFVLKDEILLSETQERSNEQLQVLKREIITIPETVSVSLLLERFLRERQHIAVVVDEHGGTKGLVTLEDVIETLMGVEIIDEMDKTEDMRILARKLWKDRARALGIDTNPGQKD